MNWGLSVSVGSRTVLTKSSYPDIGVEDTNPLMLVTGVGSGDMRLGACGNVLTGDWAKNGGVFERGI